RYLVGAQSDDGSWPGRLDEGHPTNLITTSFALLFLSKGRTPVLITKLAYGPDVSEDWNNDRNEAKNSVDYSIRSLFNNPQLAWQVFDVRGPGDVTKGELRRLTGELLQSPIVYFTGHHPPRLQGGVEDLLREYINNGGFILAEACCGRSEFDDGFRKL